MEVPIETKTQRDGKRAQSEPCNLFVVQFTYSDPSSPLSLNGVVETRYR
jgi:hypothetical protein